MQLFDHLVGCDLQCERNGKAERLRSTQVDHQLEPGRLQERQVYWLDALEYLSGIDAHLPINIWDACRVAHQSTGCRKVAKWPSRGQRVPGGEGPKPRHLAIEKRIGRDRAMPRAESRSSA